MSSRQNLTSFLSVGLSTLILFSLSLRMKSQQATYSFRSVVFLLQGITVCLGDGLPFAFQPAVTRLVEVIYLPSLSTRSLGRTGEGGCGRGDLGFAFLLPLAGCGLSVLLILLERWLAQFIMGGGRGRGAIRVAPHALLSTSLLVYWPLVDSLAAMALGGGRGTCRGVVRAVAGGLLVAVGVGLPCAVVLLARRRQDGPVNSFEVSFARYRPGSRDWEAVRMIKMLLLCVVVSAARPLVYLQAILILAVLAGSMLFALLKRPCARPRWNLIEWGSDACLYALVVVGAFATGNGVAGSGQAPQIFFTVLVFALIAAGVLAVMAAEIVGPSGSPPNTPLPALIRQESGEPAPTSDFSNLGELSKPPSLSPRSSAASSSAPSMKHSGAASDGSSPPSPPSSREAAMNSSISVLVEEQGHPASHISIHRHPRVLQIITEELSSSSERGANRPVPDPGHRFAKRLRSNLAKQS